METRESGSLQERGFPGGSKVKSPPAKAEDSGDADSVPGWGRSPGGGNGNPLQYSCPWTEEPGRLLVHDVTESDPTESTQHDLKENKFYWRYMCFSPQVIFVVPWNIWASDRCQQNWFLISDSHAE